MGTAAVTLFRPSLMWGGGLEAAGLTAVRPRLPPRGERYVRPAPPAPAGSNSYLGWVTSQKYDYLRRLVPSY